MSNQTLSLEDQGLFLGATAECAINRWAGLLLQVCAASVRQPRAVCSLDLYELSVFVCISWRKRQRKRLFREQIIPLWPQAGERRG